jgi:hypothetical protein
MAARAPGRVLKRGESGADTSVVGRRLLTAAIVLATTLTGTAASAADEVGSPDFVRSTWDQPGTAPLDGVGAYLYIAPGPAPATSQLPPDYEYLLEFFYEGGQMVGVIGLGSRAGGHIAGLATGYSRTVVVPYEWSAGRLYFLFVHRLSDHEWGAWVLDVWADAWTFIGQGSTPVEVGGLSPSTWTVVAWADSTSSNPCSAYPRTDAYFTPVFGVRGGSFTLGTRAGDSAHPNGCPGQISSSLGWARYTLG